MGDWDVVLVRTPRMAELVVMSAGHRLLRESEHVLAATRLWDPYSETLQTGVDRMVEELGLPSADELDGRLWELVGFALDDAMEDREPQPTVMPGAWHNAVDKLAN